MQENYKKVNVDKGEYKILSNYYKDFQFKKLTKEILFESIELVAGKKILTKIKKNNLKKMHLYLNPDYLPFLNRVLEKKLDLHLRKQIFYCAKNNLELNSKKPFYIDKKLNYRIIFPFEYAKKSRLKRENYLRLNLDNYKNAKDEIIKSLEAKKINLKDSDINKIKYFKNLPMSCSGHGPHRDTWFGHTFGALNLWRSITGVNKENGLLIFPKVNNIELKHNLDPPYVESNQNLKESKSISLNDGDLLTFDPEILHATRLNTSNETRIVFSGRINKKKPMFYKNTSAPEYAEWFSSADFNNNVFNKMHYFPRASNSVIKVKKRYNLKKHNFEIKINKNFELENDFKICETKKIKKNTIYKIIFKNKNFLLINTTKKYKLFQSHCPHLSIGLEDGHLKNGSLTCPGHGLIFNLTTNTTRCKKFKLKNYILKKEKNFLVIKKDNIFE